VENASTLAGKLEWWNLPAGRQVGIRSLRMFFVYAITSTKRKYLYVGLTADLKRRILEHNSGKNKTTRPYSPFELLYSESFPNRQSARKREKYLKSGAGKEFLKNI